MYIIESEKIKLLPFKKIDIKYFHQWLNDELVTKNMFYGRLPMTESQTRKMFLEYKNSGDCTVFTIQAGKRPIGFCGIFDIESQAGTGEIRILIGDKSSWGEYFGVLIAVMLTSLGFDYLGLKMVYLGTTRKDNRGATKFFELLGYKFTGVRREVLYRNGRYYDGTMLDILKEEYDRTHKAIYNKNFEFTITKLKN